MADANKDRLRAQNSDFIRMMVEKAAQKDEETKPYDNKLDPTQVENLVKQLKEQQKPKAGPAPYWTKRVKP